MRLFEKAFLLSILVSFLYLIRPLLNPTFWELCYTPEWENRCNVWVFCVNWLVSFMNEIPVLNRISRGTVNEKLQMRLRPNIENFAPVEIIDSNIRFSAAVYQSTWKIQFLYPNSSYFVLISYNFRFNLLF